MEVLTGIITDAEVVNSTQVVIDSKLPDTQVEVSKSITAEVSPDNYVLSSGGMYGAGFTGSAPTWLLDAIQQELTTGTGNVMSVLAGIQTVLDSLTLGVNQNIAQIESTILSQASLATSVQSQIDANEATILDVAATRVTPLQAQTIATQVQQSTFGVDATAFIGNIASTYVSVGSAIAQDINLITTELNNVNVSISAIDSINISQNATISQLQTDTGIAISDLQDQLDHTVDTWFYSVVPTLLNVPAVNWTTTIDKKSHNGDLYYNKVTGIAYQYVHTPTSENWVVVTNQVKIDSLYQASLRNDTIDGKRSVYYSATEPAPKTSDGVTPIPIETGDLWINSTTGITKVRSTGGLWVDITNTATENAIIDISVLEETNDGVVYSFYQATEPVTAMSYGDWWVDTDAAPIKVYRYEDINGKNTTDHITYPLAWREKNPATDIIANNAINSDYAKKKIDSVIAGTTQIDLSQHNNAAGWTTDASLTNWISTVYDPFVASTNSLIETFFGDVQPTLANTPASTWTDTATKDLHLGDIYYNTLSGIGYRFVVLGGIYSWNAISDSGVAAALEAAANAQDTADGKRRTFISGWDSVNLVWTPVLPVPPYDRGDLFTPLIDTVSGINTFYKNEVYVCNVSKLAGTVFSNTDFVAGTNAKVTLDAIMDINTDIGLLKGLVDNKVETFLQVAPPHPEITMAINHPDVLEYDTYVKDLWFSTSMGNKTYIYKRTATGDFITNYGYVTEAYNLPTMDYGSIGSALTASRDLAIGGVLQMPTGVNDYVYSWEETLVPTAVFDAIDGKKIIFTVAPSKYYVRDMLIPETTFVSGGITFQADEIYISSADSVVFDASHWSKATKYTDDTTASIAVANAADAQFDADVANSLLADIANDDKLTSSEKQKVKLEWDVIVSESVKIDANADAVGVSHTAYDTQYGLLATYIVSLLADLTTTSVIVGTTFRATFKAYYDAKVDLLNAIAVKINTVAVNKPDVYSQPTAPSNVGRVLGDLWVDTDDKNHLYRWNGTIWADIRDGSIADASGSASLAMTAATNAMTAAQAAQATADGAIRTWYQATAPAGLNATTDVGDMWFDTDDNQAYRWSGTAWIIIEDNSIAVALQAAQNAQSTADGKITSFYQTSAPTVGMETGDLWYDTDDKNKPYYYNMTTWVALRDGTIADAQTTANAKSIILYQDTTPTILTHPLLDIGDQWVNTTTKELKVWDGDSWEVTTNDIANKAYTIATADPHMYNSIASVTPVAVSPVVLAIGDLWVVTDRWYTDATTSASGTTRTTYGYLVKKYNGTVWNDITNTEAKSSVLKWEAKSSKYITAPDGSITGFEMSDGSATNSAFTITADTFKLVASGQSAASRNPMSVDAVTGEITFNGKVSFNSVTDVPALGSTPQQVVDAVNAGSTTTIDGGKITTGSIWVDGIVQSNNYNLGVSGFRLKSNGSSYIDPTIYGGFIRGTTMMSGLLYDSSFNGVDYKMKIDLDSGKIYIR